MFTGIVENTGLIKKIENFRTHTRLILQSSFSLKGSKLGDSIAVDGCCLTMTYLKSRDLGADISPETLDKTTIGGFVVGTRVNLERPIHMDSRLGGHIVQGHVDGVGTLVSKKYVDAKPDPYYLLEVKVPGKLKSYMVDKGSVAVDGISLTVNSVKGQKISLCIIPHTQERTTLTTKKVGDKLNIEADILLKYIEKMLSPILKRLNKKLKAG